MTDQQLMDTGWEIHTRRGKRHTIAGSRRVWVDFDDPTFPRKRWRVHLIDISEGGLSFVCLENRPAIECETRLTRAVIHSGGWQIWGDLQITHLSTTVGARRICGARFLPSSTGEVVKLKTLIASLRETQAV
jgi:hypothetical protein